MAELMEPSVTKVNDLTYKTSFGDDGMLNVEFYEEPRLQEFESEQAAHPIYKPEVMIRIFKPGQRDPFVGKAQLVDLPNKRSDLNRFPRAYEAFKNKTAVVHEGHPIDMWAPLTATDALNLKARNIHTVEQLSAIPDTVLEPMGFLNRKLRDKATLYLKSQGDQTLALQLQAKIDAQELTIEELKKSIKEIKELNNNTEKQRRNG